MSTAESFTDHQAPTPAGGPDPPPERRGWAAGGGGAPGRVREAARGLLAPGGGPRNKAPPHLPSLRPPRRPPGYDHMTASHPSIYDDFDAIMAAAHLLSADGAGYALDLSAWNAAYDYYGHDATGVLYADQVLARAIGWSQGGFCINCAVKP